MMFISYEFSSRCDIAYKVVEDIVFNEECSVDVQHLCEEHINIPVVHHHKPQYDLPTPPPPGLNPPLPLTSPLDLPLTSNVPSAMPL